MATVEGGSLSAAARSLGQTQPTLSRQISALEQQLGVTLFERGTRSMTLTDAGAELLAPVRQMSHAAQQIARIATGQNQSVEGQVSITSSDAMAIFSLPAFVADLRAIHPGITIDLVPSNAVSDLTRREADIAIRHVAPNKPDLIARKVIDIEVGLFATPDYVASLGQLQALGDLSTASFIAYDTAERTIPQFAQMGIPLTPANFSVTTSNGAALLTLAQKGLGITLLPVTTASAIFGLTPLFPDIITAKVPTWLVTHREIHTSPRIRIVFDALAQFLRRNG